MRVAGDLRRPAVRTLKIINQTCHVAALTDNVRAALGLVAELVGIEGGVVSGVINLESSGVRASDRRPCHEEP
jgi:hypothetical protein